MDDGFLNWFAGFVDGEGHFRIRQEHRSIQFSVSMEINMRADDLSLLLEIQERLQMGRVAVRSFENHSEKYRHRNPMVNIAVSRNDDCYRLVQIFDKHILRSRKHNDYVIWRRAVLENQKAPGSRDLAKMQFLCDKICLVRQFQSGEMDEYEPAGYQLELLLPNE